jgi:hypothetical protein
MEADRTDDRAPLSELKSDLDELKQRLCAFDGSTDLGEEKYRDPSAELILSRMSLQSVYQGTEFHFFPPRCSPSPDGILSFLGKAAKGNPHDKGVVIAFAADAYDSQGANQPKNAADVTTDTYFFSKDELNQHMGYDFKNMRVIPTHYALRSHSDSVGGRHPQTWVIESSEDGADWVQIDARTNETELDRPLHIGMFQMASIRETRFVRIRQVGVNRKDNNHLLFRVFELFGSLRTLNYVHSP